MLVAGLIWGLIFVVIEAVQFVYFGGLFQGISTFYFGFLVFGIVTVLFTGGSAIFHPEQLKVALQNPADLIGLNVFATLAWVCYLTSVSLIEPAVVYTISAGVMPIAALIADHLGGRRGSGKSNKIEMTGIALISIGIVYLGTMTIAGHSGFVRGDWSMAVLGVFLAIADGVFFTILVIYSGKLDKSGVGPSAVFGLRFPLYVLVAGGLTFSAVDQQPTLPVDELLVMILIGLVLTVPHLYALQKAITKISTTLISALTTAGPFVIFLLQIVEGRVLFSSATLAGLFIYFAGSGLCVFGALQGSAKS